MSVVEVRNLNKKYPAFHLKDVSFAIQGGRNHRIHRQKRSGQDDHYQIHVESGSSG